MCRNFASSNRKSRRMKKKEVSSINESAKILVPATGYDFSADMRLLIPFTKDELIGFVNRKGEVVAKPQFAMYDYDCYSSDDYIRVMKAVTYNSQSGGISNSKHYYGLINYKGETVLDTKYCHLFPVKGKKGLYVVENKKWEYGIITISGEVIVPFGKYDLIEGFDRGIARVKIGKRSNGYKNHGNKWGIIDSSGKEVLPVEYDEIWQFQGKGFKNIIVEKDGFQKRIPISSLIGEKHDINKGEEISQRSRYGEYAGSYAQDVMGYSDDVINDVFEGDPDAYWNID